ncbi:MAG: HEAT repeat domain-containing protein [Myxococcaceae bacterium]
MQRRLLVCFLLALSALPACSKDPATPEYWAAQLDAAKRPSEKVRVVDALRSSGKLNKSFLPMLEAELAKEKNPEEKGALARALGDLKDPSCVPALADALDLSATDGATSRMNSAIAQALGSLHDPRAVPALLKLLKSKDDYVRIDAIQALGALKATEAVAPLMELALDDASSPQVNRRAVAALGDIGDAKAVPVLLKALYKQRGNQNFASEASFSLYQVGKPAADALVQVVSGEDAELIAWARRRDVDGTVLMVQATEVLKDFAAPQAEPALLKKLSFQNPDARLQWYGRMFAANGLGRLRAQAAVVPLMAMVEENEPLPRAEYARALVLVGNREALPALFKAASRGTWNARQFAVASLSMLGDDRDLAAFDRLAQAEPALAASECKQYGCATPASEVAQQRAKVFAVFRAPLEAAGTCKQDPGCWVKKLKDDSAPVRQRAALEIGRSGHAEYATTLAERVDEADAETRIAVLQGLSWLVKGGTAAAMALKDSVPKLEQRLSDDKGKQDYVAASDALRRLLVDIRRRGG